MKIKEVIKTFKLNDNTANELTTTKFAERTNIDIINDKIKIVENKINKIHKRDFAHRWKHCAKNYRHH